MNVSDLAINADLAPTIVDVANADPGLVMDGRSLFPFVNRPGIARGRELLIDLRIERTFRPSAPSATCTRSTAPARGSSTI